MLGFDAILGICARICDGIKEFQNRTEYFVEFYVNNSYTSYYGYYTPSNPGTIIHGNTLTYFSMKWGWGGYSDDWFFENNVNPIHYNGTQYNFQSNRSNLYITP
jgi:hypothetical protein